MGGDGSSLRRDHVEGSAINGEAPPGPGRPPTVAPGAAVPVILPAGGIAYSCHMYNIPFDNLLTQKPSIVVFETYSVSTLI